MGDGELNNGAVLCCVVLCCVVLCCVVLTIVIYVPCCYSFEERDVRHGFVFKLVGCVGFGW